MSDLKACPFCGRIPEIEDCGEHRWFIRCKCGIAQDKLFFQKCDAVRAWNKRKELRVKDTNVPITDTISRLDAIDAVDSEIVSTNPEHFKSSEKFIKFMDDADIASFGKWQWANGFNTAVVASKIQLQKLPSAEPETCEGCKHLGKWENEVEYGYPSPCTRCKRRVEDRYER